MANALMDKLEEKSKDKKVRWADGNDSNEVAKSGSDELSDMDTDEVDELAG